MLKIMSVQYVWENVRTVAIAGAGDVKCAEDYK